MGKLSTSHMPGPVRALSTCNDKQHTAAALKELLVWGVTEQCSLLHLSWVLLATLNTSLCLNILCCVLAPS